MVRVLQASASFSARTLGIFSEPTPMSSPESEERKLFWIPHPTEGYVACAKAGPGFVNFFTKQSVQAPSGFRLGPAFTVNLLHEDFPDMVKMSEVNEGSILHNLRRRFENDEIYTNIGDILVSLNPYKWLNEYFTDEQLKRVQNLSEGDDAEPHIWGIASQAFRGLLNRKDQSILISGESGAGKTEATKKCLSFFAKVAGSDSTMQDKVLNANPILEAFGNAKTVRNNNSSRFGKWMVVYFNKGDNHICGSNIINYLLEQSRIVSQSPGERNYHIFYQLISCGGLSAHPSARWDLRAPQDYGYLKKGGTYGADGINDIEDFAELEKAFRTMQFDDKETDNIFSVTVATLCLGNIAFVQRGDTCQTDTTGSSGESLKVVADALGIEIGTLCDALTVKVLLAGHNRTKVPLNTEKAYAVRDSLAKWLYSRMFNWLVHRISKSMVPTANASGYRYIGVLDIFGFEIFEHNTFEQLCINFCNEKLQANFNVNVFQKEQELYAQEGIKAKDLGWVSNQHVIDLIEKKPKGIFPLLDNQWRMGSRGSDKTFLANCEKHLADRKAFVGFGPRNPKIRRGEFGVIHYAGQVMYQSSGFLDKNSDAMTLNLEEMVISARNSFVADLHHWSTSETTELSSLPSNRPGPGKKKSISGQFKQQLTSLMGMIAQTHPSYVRCIKPNSVKRAGVFEPKLTLEQLRYAGVFQAVEIRQTGYPFRLPHREFLLHFRCLFPSLDIPDSAASAENFMKSAREAVQLLEPQYPPEAAISNSTVPFVFEMQVGATKVFYRAPTHRKIERSRRIELGKSALKIEQMYRGAEARQLLKKMRSVKGELDDAMSRGMTSDETVISTLTSILLKAGKLRVQIPGLAAAKNRLSQLESQKLCRDDIRAVLSTDPIKIQSKLKSLIARATSLGMLNMIGEGPLQDPVLLQAKKSLASIPNRHVAEEKFRKGCADYDSILLDEAEELAAPWASSAIPFFTKDQLSLIGETRARIAADLAQLSAIFEAVNADCATSGPRIGRLNNIDLGAVDSSKLERLLNADDIKSIQPITVTGQHVLRVARFTLVLRCSLIAVREAAKDTKERKDAWVAVEQLIEEEIESGKLHVPSEIKGEIESVRIEIKARKFRSNIETEIKKSIKRGSLTMEMVRSGSANKFWSSEDNGPSLEDKSLSDAGENLSWKHLERLVNECAEDERANGPITSQSLLGMIHAAKLLGGLRRLIAQTLFNGQGSGGLPEPTNEEVVHGDRLPAWFPYGLDGASMKMQNNVSLPQLQTLRSKLRKILKHGDSDGSVLIQLAYPPFEAEIHVASLFLDCLDAVASVLFCLTNQRMTGTLKLLDFESYNITGIAAARAIIDRLIEGGVAPSGLGRLAEMAKLVSDLREALYTYDVDSTRTVSEKLRELTFAPHGLLYQFVKEEVEYACTFCDNNEHGLSLKKALRAHAVQSDGDFLDLSTCQVDGLAKALDDARASDNTQNKPETISLIAGGDFIVNIRRLLLNNNGNFVPGVIGPDWKTLTNISKRYELGEIELPEVCRVEMQTISKGVLALEAVESLRNIVHKSDIRATEEAVNRLTQLRSVDERTLSFIEWGHTVVSQMNLLETSCEDVLLSNSESNVNHGAVCEINIGISRKEIQDLADACSSYKYFSPLSRRVLQLNTSLEQLDKAALSASESLEPTEMLWVCSCTRKLAKTYGVKLDRLLDRHLGLCGKYVNVCFEIERLSVHDRLRLLMDRALASGDSERVVKAMFQFKEEFFHRFGTLFSLRMFECLKEPKRFARRHGVFDPNLYSNMLRYQSTPLHTSLCVLKERRERIGAIQTFHLVQGYMDGESDDITREQKCKQLQDLALRIYGLRDEIYIQIMKQLTRNPGANSRHRGWELLLSCIAVFPPTDAFENYLDYFLRQNDRPAYVKEVYRRIYLGADRSSIHKSGVYRRLSTAGLLWKKNDGIERKPIVASSSAQKQAPRVSPLKSKRQSNYGESILTLNTTKETNEVTTDLLLGKAKKPRRERPHIGRHTSEIIKKLAARSQKTLQITKSIENRMQERDAKMSIVRQRLEEERRNQYGVKTRSNYRYSSMQPHEHRGNVRSEDRGPMYPSDEDYQLYKSSIDVDQTSDEQHGMDADTTLLLKQWNEIEKLATGSLYDSHDDESMSALSDGSQISPNHETQRFDLERNELEALAKDHAGLTVRRVIGKSQPKHSHVRNYTSVGDLNLINLG